MTGMRQPRSATRSRCFSTAVDRPVPQVTIQRFSAVIVGSAVLNASLGRHLRRPPLDGLAQAVRYGAEGRTVTLEMAFALEMAFECFGWIGRLQLRTLPLDQLDKQTEARDHHICRCGDACSISVGPQMINQAVLASRTLLSLSSKPSSGRTASVQKSNSRRHRDVAVSIETSNLGRVVLNGIQTTHGTRRKTLEQVLGTQCGRQQDRNLPATPSSSRPVAGAINTMHRAYAFARVESDGWQTHTLSGCISRRDCL